MRNEIVQKIIDGEIGIEQILEIYEPVSWKEYMEGLDLTHWNWGYGDEILRDPKTKIISDDIVLYPVTSKDIAEDPLVSYVDIDNYLLISWDNFRNDIVLIDQGLGSAELWAIVVRCPNNEWEIKGNLREYGEVLERVREIVGLEP